MPRCVPVNHSSHNASGASKYPLHNDLYLCDYPSCVNVFVVSNTEISKCNQCQSRFCPIHPEPLLDDVHYHQANTTLQDDSDDENTTASSGGEEESTTTTDEIKTSNDSTTTVSVSKPFIFPRGCILCTKSLQHLNRRLFTDYYIEQYLLKKVNLQRSQVVERVRRRLTKVLTTIHQTTGPTQAITTTGERIAIKWVDVLKPPSVE